MANTDTFSDAAKEKKENNLGVQEFISQPYKYGFTTNVEVEDFPKGISNEVIKLISSIPYYFHLEMHYREISDLVLLYVH